MMKKVFIPIIVLLLASNVYFALSPSLIDKPDLLEVPRQEYLQMASKYDVDALEAQESAEKFAMRACVATLTNTSNPYLALAKRYDNLAEEYRQQARHYRTLAWRD